MRIGLFGGSFNPAHDAHRAASLLACKRLGLDRVWWLVSPGNPLKDTRGLPPLEARIASAREVAASPFIQVTGIEAMIGTRFTYDTVSQIKACFPSVRFVLVIGADILAEFHRWKRWRELAGLIPIAVIDRGGWTAKAAASPAARTLAAARIPERNAAVLPLQKPPAWVFLHGLKSPQSSTALRLSATHAPAEG
ncbi:MAG: nicotinate-nucleotide adenylyltransferase [Bradyrhizobiaceae bacterium]|nr:nicotinate-nucleotide adenylyltransferase [Bradyrhizobiaceae bacterium]